MNSQPFAELICAYLDGVPGATDVLNDALEESGRERSMQDGTASERLALVLENLLIDSVAKRVSLDFARHVIEHCEGPLARAVLQQKVTQANPDAGPEERQQAAQILEPFRPERLPANFGLLHRLGWGEEVTPASSAAWALWGALMIPVRYVAVAAQRANTTELQWQIEHLKQVISE